MLKEADKFREKITHKIQSVLNMFNIYIQTEDKLVFKYQLNILLANGLSAFACAKYKQRNTVVEQFEGVLKC